VRKIVMPAEVGGGVWAPTRQDPRSNESNTEAVEGAPWVHFHHRTSDMSAAPRGGRPGRPLCVEMVCHACHESALVLFRVDLSTTPPETVRGEEVGRVGNEFVQYHKTCRADRGVGYQRTCDARRSGEPKVFDFAGPDPSAS